MTIVNYDTPPFFVPISHNVWILNECVICNDC